MPGLSPRPPKPEVHVMRIPIRRVARSARSAALLTAAIAVSASAGAVSATLADEEAPARAAGEETRAAAAQATGPRVFGRFDDASVRIPAADTDLLTLPVPAGNYVIMAKATLVHAQDTAGVRCRLLAGNDFDEARIFTLSPAYSSSMSLTVLHGESRAFTARLRCGGASDARIAGLEDVKLTAIQVGSIDNRPG
jgi:hypothetical protein